MDKDKDEKDPSKRRDAHFPIPPCQLEKVHQRGNLRITGAIIEVAPLYSKTRYALPLTTVAEMIVSKVVKADMALKGRKR